MSDGFSMLDWPSHIERTPSDQRKGRGPFDVNFSRTRSELSDEMDKLGAEQWRLDTVTGSAGDPGVVLRWVKDGNQYVAANDKWSTKKANLRDLYLWVNETRMRNDRGVRTGRDNFAAARLPAGDEPASTGPMAPSKAADILGVPVDADEEAVQTAWRERMGEEHPDAGGEDAKMVNRARDVLRGGR